LRRRVVAVALGLSVAATAGCGQGRPPLPRPLLFGEGALYRPAPYGPRVASARTIGRLRCEAAAPPARFLAHVEVIVDGRVAIVPAGIGVAPPQVRRGAYVVRGRCEYPIRTHEPTGLLEVASSRRITLGELFAVWQQPLTRQRLLEFAPRRGSMVRAYVGRARWPGDPREIVLRRHRAVTLELGRFVPPRPRYAFPRGI